MPPRLLDHSVACIDQHDGKIRRARARHHIARVLHMARRVGNDELALWRRKISVCHVDGNSLLTLGTQAISEVGEIHLPAAGDIRRTLQHLHLILHDRFRIIKQPPNQRTLAVINRPARVKAQ